MGDSVTREATVQETCDHVRDSLKHLEQRVRFIKGNSLFRGEQAFSGQHGEMIAQSELAVRAIEEARMRLGKVLQYSGDGVSIYDKL